MPILSKLFHRCPNGCVPMLRCSNPDEPSLLFCLVRGNHFTLTCKCASNPGSTNSTTCEEGAEVCSCYNSYGNPITSIQTIEECIDIGGTWKTYCDPDYIDDQCTCPTSTTGLCSKSCKVVATCSSSGTTDCAECLETGGHWSYSCDCSTPPEPTSAYCAANSAAVCYCVDEDGNLITSANTINECIAADGIWKSFCDTDYLDDQCACPTSTGGLCSKSCKVVATCSSSGTTDCAECLKTGGHWSYSCDCSTPPDPTSAVCAAGSAEVCTCVDSTGKTISTATNINDCVAAYGTWRAYCDANYTEDQCTCPTSTTGICTTNCKPTITCSASSTTDCASCLKVGGRWNFSCNCSIPPDPTSAVCGAGSAETCVCLNNQNQVDPNYKTLDSCLSAKFKWQAHCDPTVTTDQCLCPTSNAGHCASGCKTIVKCSNSGTTVCGDCIARGGKWSIECQCPTLRQIDVSGMGILGVE